jgi:hypothetical protein
MAKIKIEEYKKLMHPLLFERWLLYDNLMKKVGLAYIITSISRTILMQMALYVQGRLTIDTINLFRYEAGMKMIHAPDNKIVTYTLQSYHVTNMFDKELNNDTSRAFDIALLKFNRPHWDVKISVNKDEEPDYIEQGRIAQSVGLTSGAFFKHPDYCHNQVEI